MSYFQNLALPNLLDEMEGGLDYLQRKLSARGIKSTIVYYQHFDADLFGLGFSDLLAYPVFLVLEFDPVISQWLICVYDLVAGKYKLLFCNTLISPANNHRYEIPVCTDILQISAHLTAALDLPAMLEQIKYFGSN